MTIKYDLSSTLQPYPLRVHRNDRDIEDLDELGSLLVRRSLSPHAARSGGMAGEVHLPVASNMFTAANNIAEAHGALASWQGAHGIIRLTPDDDALAAYDGISEDIGLLNGFRLPVEELLQRSKNMTLVLSSPNGISGRIATLQEVIRLARHFRLVVIDERLAAFSMRRLTPLVMEWENIVFVQRFPFIMPGQTSDIAWIVHPADLRAQIADHAASLPQDTVDDTLQLGGISTFQAERYIARQKSQLYRELRKLSIVSVPYPTWSNALLARVERGDRDTIVQQLAQQGISVYTPPHPNLQQHFRVTAVSSEATTALREALVNINLAI